MTDHHALVPLSKKELPDLPEKLRDIFMDMRPYNLVMRHIPGKKNLTYAQHHTNEVDCGSNYRGNGC